MALDLKALYKELLVSIMKHKAFKKSIGRGTSKSSFYIDTGVASVMDDSKREFGLFVRENKGNSKFKINFVSILKDIPDKVTEDFASSIIDVAIRGIRKKLPYYYFVSRRIKFVDDSECTTLFITFNRITRAFELHYNRTFMVHAVLCQVTSYLCREGITCTSKVCNFTSGEKDIVLNKLLSCDSLFSGFVSEFEGMAALLISHEIEHMLRANLEDSDGVSKLSNIVEDSFINSHLSEIYLGSELAVGVSNRISFDVSWENYPNFDDFLDEFSYRIMHIPRFFRVYRTPEVGDSGSISLDFTGSILRNIVGNNSIEGVKIAKTIMDMFGNHDENSIKEVSSSGISSGGLPSSLCNLGKQIEERTKGDSEVGEVGDTFNSMLKSSKKDMDKAISEGVVSGSTGVSGKVNNVNIYPEAVQQLIATGDIKTRKGAKAQYYVKFRKLLSASLGVTEVYDNNSPSARIEGAFGRDVETPSIKRVAILLDCSASMEPKKFKSVIEEIPPIIGALKGKIEITVVYWGGTYYIKKFKSQNLYRNIQSGYKSLGGTDFDGMLTFCKDKGVKADCFIIMTDGVISTFLTSTSKAYFNRNKKKIIWVLVGNHKEAILNIDSSGAQRLVKIGKEGG